MADVVSDIEHIFEHLIYAATLPVVVVDEDAALVDCQDGHAEQQQFDPSDSFAVRLLELAGYGR